MTYIENADYFIRVVDMPPRLDSLVSPNPDGTFNMYLDSKRSRLQQIDDYIHEFEHIDNDDFYNDKQIYEIETEDL